jgi:hypothetical protein
MLAPVTHILPLTTIRRERLLPAPGRVLARLEQKVTPMDVVAEANYGQEHALLDVAHLLHVTPEVAKTMIQVKVGDAVGAGQVIAQNKGLIPQVVKAPSSGKVILVGGGQVLLEIGETSIELHAGMPGLVTRLIPDRGVEITFSGALVQGVWGNGRVDTGLILPMLENAGDSLTSGMLDVSQRGSIILSGYCNDPAALTTAAELPARGLVLGSLSPALLTQAAQLPFPVMIIDGFVHNPLNGAAFKLLTSNAKREVTVNAEAFDRYSGTRPELFISLPVSQEPPASRDVETFAPNQPVRLIRAPHAGAVGTLLNLRPGLSVMPSGLHVLAAEVKLESGEQVIVPLANLEVLG